MCDTPESRALFLAEVDTRDGDPIEIWSRIVRISIPAAPSALHGRHHHAGLASGIVARGTDWLGVVLVVLLTTYVPVEELVLFLVFLHLVMLSTPLG
jgi:hypothetical protein